jgi:nucleotide-binding universal stress UspA family protein
MTVAVGYDGGAAAGVALDRAILEARERQERLVVIAVEEMPLDPTGPRFFGTLDDSPAVPFPPVPPPELEAVLESAGERAGLDQAQTDFVWAAGNPVEQIVKIARDRGATLIVLGAHHHRHLAGLFGTDVAAAVQREAGCDVVVADA